MNYYNEFDPKAAQWLRELIKAGHISPGDVDERSISDVRSTDLVGYRQCHFFAGIGGWSYALRLAGVSDDEPIWTGSCPCQPFSGAGLQRGESDERHLWPELLRLIKECSPARVFGEQVASPLGRKWLDGVRSDVEALAYGFGSADLCAASIGAPHIRQRLYWMAVADCGQRDGLTGRQGCERDGQETGRIESNGEPECSGEAGGLAFGEGQQWHGTRDARRRRDGYSDCSDTSGIPDSEGAGRPHRGPGAILAEPPEGGRMGSPILPGSQGHAGHGDNGRQSRRLDTIQARSTAEASGAGNTWMGDTASGGRGELRDASQPGSRRYVDRANWSDYDIIPFLDGKQRRVESGTFPLAHGVSGRVGLLRGYGNAIVPQLAAEFIQACYEAENLI